MENKRNFLECHENINIRAIEERKEGLHLFLVSKEEKRGWGVGNV